MTIKATAVLIGKTKAPIKEDTKSGKPTYSLMVSARERYFDRATKKTSFEWVTVFVNLYGSLSDKMKEILSKDGVPVIITGELDKTVARDKKTNEPMVYKEGARKGDFMYDIRLRGTTSDVNLAPRETEETASAKPVATTVGDDTNNDDDGMYV